MVSTSHTEMTACSSMFENSEILARSSSGMGRSARHSSAFGMMPISSSFCTECWLGLVLSSPAEVMKGTKVRWTKAVKKLREIGIMPNALLCRADRPIPDDERAKISLFSNIEEQAVISVWDVDTIYKVPQMLHDQGLDAIICDALDLNPAPADLSVWSKLIYTLEHPKTEVSIGMVGKYVDLTESYKSLTEALRHAGIHNESRVNIEYIDSEEIETTGCAALARFDAILVPGGFGKRGVEGKIMAAQFAREN